MIKVAYIAGPFRAANAWEIEQGAHKVWRLLRLMRDLPAHRPLDAVERI